MNEETKELVSRLYKGANALDSLAYRDTATDIRRAASEIEKLAYENERQRDEIDFRMADQLSSAVMQALLTKIKEETGYEAQCGPFVVDNEGFSGWVRDGSVGGHFWLVAVHRKERIDAPLAQASFGDAP